MLQIYKPTPKNTGSACSFYLTKEGHIMSTLIKQDSWNGKTASFQKNKGNPKGSVVIKLSQTEVCSILNAIDQNKEFSTFHNSEKQSVGIKFGPYIKDGNQVGFSYSVNKEIKQDGGKVGFLIGIKLEEARLIKEFLTFALHDSFRSYSQNKIQQKESEETPPEAKNSQEEQQEVDF